MTLRTVDLTCLDVLVSRGVHVLIHNLASRGLESLVLHDVATDL